MARPLRIEYEGAFYHVTSRGNEKKEIFKNRRDREQFLSYLQSAVERYDAVIHAYCLMTNHYHLLLETPRGILSHFSAPSEKSGYRKFVEDLIGKTYETPLKAVVASTLLGTPGFVAEVSEKHASGLQPDRHVPSIKHLARCHSTEKVLEAAKEVVGAENGLWRKVSIHLCQRHTGMKLKDIGEKFGIGDAAVSVTSKRVHALAENNPKIQEVLRAVRMLLNVET